MSCLRCLCLFTYSGVQHKVCCVFVAVLRLMRPVLPTSMDCPFLIVPLVFSKVYLPVLFFHHNDIYFVWRTVIF